MVKENLHIERQDNVKIGSSMVSSQCKKMANWKTPGPDGVQGFWVKHLSVLHEPIANSLASQTPPLYFISGGGEGVWCHA